MRTTRALSVTLPHEMADMVREKVGSGEYASESEVIRERLRALQARDAALERWLREEAAAAYDAHKAHPHGTLSVEEVLSQVKGHQRKPRG